MKIRHLVLIASALWVIVMAAGAARAGAGRSGPAFDLQQPAASPIGPWYYLPLILVRDSLPTATPTTTPSPTGTATPTATPVCYEALTNGDFESDQGWIIRDNPVLAAYVGEPVHGGLQSMRTGIAAGLPNVESYSPIEQAVIIPAGASATLSFWRSNVWGDGSSGKASAAPPDLASLPRTEAELYQSPQLTDYFYAIAIQPNGGIRWLLVERTNQSWRKASVDLSALAGQTIRLQFGTYNDGNGGLSRTFVDDASLQLCLAAPPPVTPTATPTVTTEASPTPSATATPSATPTATETATSPPTSTPTATVSPTPTAIATATPGIWATPYWAGQLDLPVASHPHGIAISPDGKWAYVAFHGLDHSGRTLGLVNEYLSLQSQVELAELATGPNGVALGPDGRIFVANRQTNNASVVDPATNSVVGAIPADALPDGVIVHGGAGYIANYGSNTVTVFDPDTLTVVRTLHNVGKEPALFAVDPASNDVYLSAHGSDQVTVLRDGLTANHFNGIPEPYGLSYDPASRRLYVANRGTAHTVTVIDVYLDRVVGTIDTGKEPFVLYANPESGHLFVVCGDEVRVYDMLDWSLVTSIPVPAGAEEGIAFDSRLSKVFVTSRDSDALTVIQDQGPPRIIFASNRDGNGELYRMLPDGTRQTRLTFTSDASENAPAASPDGRWIAYERRDGVSGPSQIWLMSRDGRGATMLTDGPHDNLHPTWNAASDAIAIASDRDGDWEIYVIDLATRGLTRLTDNDAADLDPDWSWQNGRIAFQSNRNGPNAELFTMAADGSDVRQVTWNPNGDSQPSWAPDGNRIAFWGTRPAGQGLYTVRGDGSDVTLFAPQSLRPASPAWGFVGETVVFQGYRPDSGHSEIMRSEADGSGLVLLTYNEVDFDYSPEWLPGW